MRCSCLPVGLHTTLMMILPPFFTVFRRRSLWFFNNQVILMICRRQLPVCLSASSATLSFSQGIVEHRTVRQSSSICIGCWILSPDREKRRLYLYVTAKIWELGFHLYEKCFSYKKTVFVCNSNVVVIGSCRPQIMRMARLLKN